MDNLGYSLTDEWLDYIIENASASVFIAKSQEDVIGIATCMINEMDSTHALMNIVVRPEYRNKGVGTQLHEQVISYAKASGIKTLEAYIKERLSHGVNFANNRGFTPILYAWEMSREVNEAKIDLARENHKDLIFRQATIGDNLLYADIINQAFGDAISPSVLEELLKDPSVMVYILEKQGQAIGSTTIQLKTNLSVGYIYDVAIIEGYRGQGFGTYMIGKSIQELAHHKMATASLTVTGDNRKALSLYKRIGFKEKDIDILGTVPTVV